MTKYLNQLRRVYHKLQGIRKAAKMAKAIADFDDTSKPPINKGLIVCWELGGFGSILTKNATFAKALNARGYRTHFIICDGVSEACMQRGLEQDEKLLDWPNRCIQCKVDMKQRCKLYNIVYSFTSEYVNKDEQSRLKEISETIGIEDIANYTYLGVGVGELALSSTNRYFKGRLIGTDAMSTEDQKIYRTYLYAALLNTHIAESVFDSLNPHSLFTSHGVYVDYAPPLHLGALRGLKVLSWSSGFSPFYHYFIAPQLNKPELRSMSDEEWQQRKAKPLTEAQLDALDAYFHGRYFEAKARDLQIDTKPEESSVLKAKLGINNDNPVVCLFAHVNWDACFDTGSMMFESHNQWIIASIEKMSKIEDVNWIIRVHPGELTGDLGSSLVTTTDLIKDTFPQMPSHITVLPHDSAINSYGIFQLIDTGITIFGTVAVEVPYLGKPMIMLGQGYIGDKGFSIDIKSKEQYFSVLENIRDITPLVDSQIDKAKQYAYRYFIQRQIPLNIINRQEGHWGNIDINRLDELLPGKDDPLDRICEGIINGTDVYLN